MDREEFAKILASGKPFILDGSTGANLMKRGMPDGVCPELWIIENPGVLAGLQREYADGGSDAVCAATFGANRESLKRYGLEDRTKEINERLVAVTREAVGNKSYVMGDLSPSGLFLAPYGDAEFNDVYEIFFEQAKILDEAGVDLFLIETQLSLAEARVSLLAVRAASKKPVIVCVSVDEKGFTMGGNSLASCLLVLSSLGADAVGCNCSVGPDKMYEILEKEGKYSYAPLVAKANAGKPHGEGADMYFDVDCCEFCGAYGKIIASGVQIIGGCCGSTPDYIKHLCGEYKNIVVPPVNRGDTDLDMCAANEKELFFIDRKADLPELIECSIDLEDSIMDALDDGAKILRIQIAEEEDADLLLRSSFLINAPLMLCSINMEALDLAMKKYPGRVIIDPGCELSDVARRYFKGKYNPVFLN